MSSNQHPSPLRLLIRPARTRDAPALTTIYVTARENALPDLPHSFSDVEVRHWLATDVLANEDVWVASEQGVVKGFMALDRDVMTHLWVSPPFQRRGIGTALLHKAQHLREEGLACIVHDWNETGQAFLKAANFVRDRAHPPAFDGTPRSLFLWTPEAENPPSDDEDDL
jgi:ribosomal protein S18 acetylase RimI-like enzyme